MYSTSARTPWADRPISRSRFPATGASGLTRTPISCTRPLSNWANENPAFCAMTGFSEAELIVQKVRARGEKVWTVYAGNEGHGTTSYNAGVLHLSRDSCASCERTPLNHWPPLTANSS